MIARRWTPARCFAARRTALSRTGGATLAVAIAYAIGAAALTSCAGGSQGESSAHPAKLTGRWVRLKEDQTWGDTMEFAPDGKLHGSAGYPVPSSLKWEVKRDSTGTEEYCAKQGPMGFCRKYRLSGDTLELLGAARGSTLFRRVR